MLGGVVLGVIFALIFQPDLLDQLIAQEKFHNTYQLIIQAVGSRMTLSTGVSEVDELLTTGGMEGMLDTVWLIIAALTFGGVMEASGSLKRVGEAFMHFIYNDTSLVSTTILTCIFFNITACDQYLSIVVPGKMMQKIYEQRGLKPEVLSRALGRFCDSHFRNWSPGILVELPNHGYSAYLRSNTSLIVSLYLIFPADEYFHHDHPL